jgi:hypothetical protein
VLRRGYTIGPPSNLYKNSHHTTIIHIYGNNGRICNRFIFKVKTLSLIVIEGRSIIFFKYYYFSFPFFLAIIYIDYHLIASGDIYRFNALIRQFYRFDFPRRCSFLIRWNSIQQLIHQCRRSLTHSFYRSYSSRWHYSIRHKQIGNIE